MRPIKVIVLVLLSLSLAAPVTGDQCPPSDLVIFYVNGVGNDLDEAEYSRLMLQETLQKSLPASCAVPRTFLNWNISEELWGLPVQDWLQAFSQFDGVDADDPDLQNHLTMYRAFMQSEHRVLVVAHSQGNFYANAAYDILAAEVGSSISEKFSLVSVATPDNRVGIDFSYASAPYVTLNQDPIKYVPLALDANEDAPCTSDQDSTSWACHGFVSSYLTHDAPRDRLLQLLKAAAVFLPRAPITVSDSYSMTQGSILTVPAPGVLANDTYPLGATIEFLPPFPPGGLTNVAPYDGGFILDMSLAPSFTGPLSLQYIIHSSSGDSNVGNVTVQVTPAPATQLQISSGNNQVGAPMGILPNALSVLATNQFGSPVGLVPVTFRVTAGGGCVSGSPTGTDCQSEAALLTNGTSGPLPGKAGVFWKLGALVGTQTIEVVSPGLATITFTATASATGPAPTPFSVSASGLPEDIPNPGSITRRMLITTAGTIRTITLFFAFPTQCERNHRATLTDPGGRTVVVMDRGLQRCSGIREPYSSTNVGIAGLFDGRRADGEWIFTIHDLDADAYSGSLRQVTLSGDILSTPTTSQ